MVTTAKKLILLNSDFENVAPQNADPLPLKLRVMVIVIFQGEQYPAENQFSPVN